MTTIIKKLVTHNGSFHADDIFSAAVLSLYLEKKGEEFEIIRTRDPEIIEAGDYVFDIGYVYNSETNKFDHHQPDGAGGRSFGDVNIKYASFGLVWKKFGIKLCDNQKAVDLIDGKLAAPIDAFDNGFDLAKNLYETSPYYLQHFFLSMRPTWKEENITNDEMFFESVEIAKKVLLREINYATDFVLAEEQVLLAYNNAKDKKIIVLEKNYPSEFILHDFSEPLFVIYPRKTDNTWGAKAVPKYLKTFQNRKDFPKDWGGLRDKELQKVAGVSDAVFCHHALYMAVAKSKEGAVKLAQIAVES